ncbi:MAG: DUF2279 domain-containing protein [Flavobacteriales bacterium]|nr:DUF2279 domain-containing protein [Flavobacteriales bacterium]
MKSGHKFVLTSLLSLAGFCASAQHTIDSATAAKRKKTFVLAGNAMAYSGSMYGLYNLWYKDYPLTKFHFHNDNHDWYQMDKVGHAYSCYYEGVVGIDMLKWAGFSHRTASILGGSYGFFIQTGVEIFDGFSEGWGASSGDMLANTLGAGLSISQSLAWQEQRIWMKLSYRPTNFAAIRPELLGRNFVERLFKDYNGQTYWLSGNIASFLPEENHFPKWLNVAIGYGIDGFVSSDDNIFERNGVTYNYSFIPQFRQLYISPDIDLTRIKTDKTYLKIALRMLNCIKFPLPGVSYNLHANGINFHFVQF